MTLPSLNLTRSLDRGLGAIVADVTGRPLVEVLTVLGERSSPVVAPPDIARLLETLGVAWRYTPSMEPLPCVGLALIERQGVRRWAGFRWARRHYWRNDGAGWVRFRMSGERVLVGFELDV